MNNLVFHLLTISAMSPVLLFAMRSRAIPDVAFWSGLALAVLAPVLWSAAQLTGSWRTNFSADLWAGIAASLVFFAVLCVLHRQAWRLTILVIPYLMGLGMMATLFSWAPAQSLPTDTRSVWIGSHIVASIATLGLLTVAAAAALATFIQARALKLKRIDRWSRVLPAVSESEQLFERLLILSEMVLAVGVVTGMGTQFAETGQFFVVGQKTLFSLLSFLLIGALLVGRQVCGVRGRVAVRVVMVAYSLVIFGYFGAKLVSQLMPS